MCNMIYNNNNNNYYIFRRRVIASLQSVIMYEYLPSFLGEDVSPYPGYKPDTHPGISHVFQSAAFRYQLFSINDFYDLKMHENTTYF